MINIKLPNDVEYIINKINKKGFEAFAVGGCIRDSILNRNPNDWDITTNALPEDIIRIFDKTIPTGIKHGTITVVYNNENYEITTYRVDGDYVDSRRPDDVIFVKNIKEDLSRRDFTINALAYNYKDGLKDYYNGIDDINSEIIKAVGDPLVRFEEDALRMMRAVRFSSQLNFNIDNNTRESIKTLSSNISNISIERVRDEFNKLVIADVKKLNDLLELGLLKEFIPELSNCVKVEQENPYHIYNVFNHTIVSADNIQNRLDLRLTMLFHDIGKRECKSYDKNGIAHFYKHNIKSSDLTQRIMKRMKYDNVIINKVVTLVKHHDNTINSSKSIRKLLSNIGEDNFKDLLLVKKADLLGQNPKYHKEGLEQLKLIESKFKKIIKDNNCFSIKDLDITGNEVIDLGVKKGKDVGLVLKYLLDKVIEKPELNNRRDLVILTKKWIARE